ncbi:MAG TPA: hypothetical protein VIK14_07400 [Ignavibacteria bacterium]
MEIYVSLTETALMILYAQREKKINKKSFLENYTHIFVKEKENGVYNSEKLLNEINSFTLNQFLRYFAIPNLTKILTKLDTKKRSNISKQFGNSKNIRRQFRYETKNLKKSLSYMINNRIRTKDGESLPLFKAYNKIKHGMQYISDGNNISFILNYSDDMQTQISKYFIMKCNLKDIEYYYTQIEIMVKALKDLLMEIYQ